MLVAPNKRIKTSLNTSFIICSILTLDPNNKIFKNFELKRDLASSTKNKNCILTLLTAKEFVDEIYDVLNKSSTRQMAHTLIRPILQNCDRIHYPLTDPRQNFPRTRILKKYLKKFKHFYRRYFLTQGEKSLNIKNDKIINYFAIQALFLIVGI